MENSQENVEVESNVRKVPDAPLPKHERFSLQEECEPRKSTSSPLHIKILCQKPQSREEVGVRKLTDSPLRNDILGQRNSSNSSTPGDTPKRSGRHSVGSGRSSGVSSPSWEKKGTEPSTPGRSRLRSVTKGDETTDDCPVVPKFGEWDENDPASAEGYTFIFNRVRDEKNNEAGKVPIMPTETSYYNNQKQYENDNTKGCGCFSWGK